MSYYVPGTEETDTKKVIMSLQQTAGNTATNTADIATNAAAIAALNAATYVNSIAGNSGAFTLSTGLANTVNALRVSLSSITASLSGDVALNNTGSYFDGPSVAQGTSGTWLVSGAVTCTDTAGSATFFAKLWDGTTVIASGGATSTAANTRAIISLSGVITSPAGNLRISVNDAVSTSGFIRFNNSGNSKDSTITAFRIA